MGKEKHEVLSSEIIRQRFLIILLALTLLAIASGCNFDDFSPSETKINIDGSTAQINALIEDQPILLESENLERARVIFSYFSSDFTEEVFDFGEEGQVSSRVENRSEHIGSGTIVSFRGETYLLTVNHVSDKYRLGSEVGMIFDDGKILTTKFNTLQVCDLAPSGSIISIGDRQLPPTGDVRDGGCLLLLDSVPKEVLARALVLPEAEPFYPEIGQDISYFNQNGQLIELVVTAIDKERHTVTARAEGDFYKNVVCHTDSGGAVTSGGEFVGTVMAAQYDEAVEVPENCYPIVIISVFDPSSLLPQS